MDGFAPGDVSSWPKVFLQRDYSDGTAVKFEKTMPRELDERVDRQRFEDTVNRLNQFYAEAERLSRWTYCEGCLACLTAYLLYLCIDTHYEKCMKKAAVFLDEQNRTYYNGHGVHLIDPAQRGLRVLEICIAQPPTSV